MPKSSKKVRGHPPFRQMAIDHAAGSQIGNALNTYWRGMKQFTLTAFILLASLFLFLLLVEYSPIHRVPAFVDVSGGLINLSAIEDARISEILVKEGGVVEKGAILAVLNTDRVSVNGNARGQMLAIKLGSEREMLAREVAAAREEAEVNRELADRKVAGLIEERRNLMAQLSTDELLLISLQAQSARFTDIARKGHVAQLQADEKADEVLVQQSRLAISRATLARIEKEIDVTRLERQLADTRLASIVESRDRYSGELDRESVVADGNATQLVVAPDAGTVSSALVSRGQSVMIGQTLFTIVPQGEPLIIRVLVPARAAGVMHAGVAIKLALHAYPQERFGLFDATVEQVSTTPLMPVDLPPIYAASGPSYIAIARFTTPPRGPDGELPLKVGMLSDALVPLEQRSAMAWLLEPLMRGFNTATGRNSISPEAHQ